MELSSAFDVVTGMIKTNVRVNNLTNIVASWIVHFILVKYDIKVSNNKYITSESEF